MLVSRRRLKIVQIEAAIICILAFVELRLLWFELAHHLLLLALLVAHAVGHDCSALDCLTVGCCSYLRLAMCGLGILRLVERRLGNVRLAVSG
jgi:hypothetical protein